MRATSALLLSASLFMSIAEAQADSEVEVLKGHIYSLQICGQCHAVDRNDFVSPNPASPPFHSIMSRKENTDMALLVWLHSPHETMPDIRVEADDLQNLVAYMASLRPASQTARE